MTDAELVTLAQSRRAAYSLSLLFREIGARLEDQEKEERKRRNQAYKPLLNPDT